jgi:hypothetical protein
MTCLLVSFTLRARSSLVVRLRTLLLPLSLSLSQLS